MVQALGPLVRLEIAATRLDTLKKRIDLWRFHRIDFGTNTSQDACRLIGRLNNDVRIGHHKDVLSM